MMQVAFPIYARTESREELRALHARATRVHAAVIFPLLASLIVLAPVLVPFVFGPAWTPAVHPTQILAGAGMVAAVLTGYPQIMLAVGRPAALLRFNVAVLAGYAAVIAVASSMGGLIMVSVAVVGAYALILIGVYRVLLVRHAGIPMRGLVTELGPAAASCLALVAVAVPALALAQALGLPDPLALAAVGSLGLAAYAAALRTVFPRVWADIRMLGERIAPPLGRLAARLGRAGRARRARIAVSRGETG
jgi:O-antigen/teichoic acid export membrane protein